MEPAVSKSAPRLAAVGCSFPVTSAGRTVLEDKVKTGTVLATTGQLGYEHFADRGRGGIKPR